MRIEGRQVAACVVGVAAFALLVGTLRDYGLTLDEPVYVSGADRVAEWFRGVVRGGARGSFRDEAIQQSWVFARPENLNLPVPVMLSAAGHELTRRWAGGLVSYRVGHAGLMALTVAVLFSYLAGLPWGSTPTASLGADRGELAAKRTDWESAAVGAASLLFMPRVFAHAHLNATDVPTSCFWLLAIIAWLRAESNWRWSVVAAIVCGLGLATKATFVIVPALLVAWLIVLRRWSWWRAGVLVVVISPVVMLLLCPMWWADPTRAMEYFRSVFQGSVWKIETFYLGETYIGGVRPLPWHSALVLPAVTTPPWTLALVACSAIIAWLRRRDRAAGLWLMAASILPVLRLLPSTPGHDGIRLMLPSIFCLAPLAAVGFRTAMNGISRVLARRATRAESALSASSSSVGGSRWCPPGCLSWMAAIGLCLASALHVARLHPYQMSYYSELVGGLDGAERLGFEVSYWFEAYNPQALEAVQRHLPRGARVWTFPQYTGYPLLREWGLWRPDLVDGDIGQADYLVLYSRKSRFYAVPGIEATYRRNRPIWSAESAGVQIIGLYKL